jgi:hypothetical protein
MPEFSGGTMMIFIDQNCDDNSFDWRGNRYATPKDFSMLAEMPVGQLCADIVAKVQNCPVIIFPP